MGNGMSAGFKKTLRISSGVTALALCMATGATGAFAQSSDQAIDADDDNVIIVTGSLIRRPQQEDSPAPIAVLGSEDIATIGAKNVAQITQTLTTNTGAQNNPDAFTQGTTTGTSNINLRGLGVASTLILLNSKRQVVSGATTNDGLNFVDTASLVPLIAVERLEILKDGASATYGSDAVAGVVNFITRNKFSGLEVSADYSNVTNEGTQPEYTLAALGGFQFDRGGIVAAVSYTDRNSLTTAERRLSRSGVDDLSVLGNPGSFFSPQPFIDPGCAVNGGLPQLRAPSAPTRPDIGFCRFDFGQFFNLVPEETRLQAFVHGEFELTDAIKIYGEFSYARNRARRGNSPSFPILTRPTVPGTHPGNFLGRPAAFFGRAIGNGGSSNPSFFRYNTYRYNIGLVGEFGDDGYWDISYTHGLNKTEVSTPDTINSRFNAALNGFGGAACPGAANGGVAGVGPCEYFNPFSTSFNTMPNSQNILDFISGRQVGRSTVTLDAVDAVVSNNIGEIGGRPIGVAIGGQFRKESLTRDFDAISNANDFAFLIGNPDFTGSRDIYAAFGELSLPLTDALEVQAALRYESFGGAIGSTVDPKIALLFKPADGLAFRASYSTAFRAPSIFQQFGTGTSLRNTTDPITGGTFFVAVRATTGLEAGKFQGFQHRFLG